MSGANLSSTEITFNRSHSASLTGTLLFFAGLGCLGLAVIGFGVAIVGRPGQLGLHAMSTMPAIIGIAALSGSWSLLRTPHRIRVGSDGLTIETGRGIQFLRWDDIGCAALETAGSSHRSA